MQAPRSKLFLAGDCLSQLDEALQSGPDALSIDLEDGVAGALKSQARTEVARLLQARRLPCQVWVRINGLDSGQTVADLLALAGAQVDVINLPKVQAPSDLVFVERLLAHIEQDSGRTTPIRIVPTIETAQGLRRAAAIAKASPRVLALQLGAGDLLASTGIARAGPGLNLIRAALSLAAAEAGLAALDSTPHSLSDPSAFEADAQQALALGFQGKSCMAVQQVAVANRVFGASPRTAPVHRSDGFTEQARPGRP